MTRVEFDKKLAEINFKEGVNTEILEDYLLACLVQLERHKNEVPSFELFLKIFAEARNGPKTDFDLLWKYIYDPVNSSVNDQWENSTGIDSVIHELRSLVTDLIYTKEIRSRPNSLKPKFFPGEWDTEGGVRFYNGTTPSSILGYAAMRFEGEYPASAFQEIDVDWEEFTAPIWIGISYE